MENEVQTLVKLNYQFSETSVVKEGLADRSSLPPAGLKLCFLSVAISWSCLASPTLCAGAASAACVTRVVVPFFCQTRVFLWAERSIAEVKVVYFGTVGQNVAEPKFNGLKEPK